jgi:hypothetical protein
MTQSSENGPALLLRKEVSSGRDKAAVPHEGKHGGGKGRY